MSTVGYKWIVGALLCCVVAVMAALLLPGGVGPASLPSSAVFPLSSTLSQPTGCTSPSNRFFEAVSLKTTKKGSALLNLVVLVFTRA